MENQETTQPIQVTPTPTPPPTVEQVKPPRSKGLIFGILAVVLVVLLGGAYVLGKNNATSKPTETIVESTSTPTLNPLGNPPPGNIDFPSGPFEKRNYKLSDKIYEKASYPSELTSKSDSELIGFKCTPNYDINFEDEGLMQNDANGNSVKLTNQLTIYLAEKAGRMHKVELAGSMFICQTQNNDQYIIYGILKGGGGSGNVSYIGKLNPDTSISELASIPNNYAAYGDCRRILQIDSQNIYLECRGGDVGGATLIIAINPETKNKSQIIKCTDGPTGDGSISKTECSDGQSFINK